MTDVEPAPKPTEMLPVERQVGFGLAVVGAVAGIVIGAVGRVPELTAVWLVAVGILALAVRRGHRVYTSIASLVAGIAIGAVLPILPVQLPFMGYGLWIMLRTSKAQGKVNAARPRMTPQQRRQAREARAASKSGKSAAAGPAEGSGSRQPSANRRYTPPKTKPGKR